ncbi:unnamed protein product [Blepharisma stoltei]|uniref:Uncharacterized protein n=1 Tax=Blepharisma stoltei TaxID=1481888 RepID=A0AAU9JQI8_9CILI|nr:unnamed protein product [Blepharisma stoltei]
MIDTFKVILIGDPCVGKSNLFKRCVENTFTEEYQKTMGCSVSMKTININEEGIKFQLWDTLGGFAIKHTFQLLEPTSDVRQQHW